MGLDLQRCKGYTSMENLYSHSHFKSRTQAHRNASNADFVLKDSRIRLRIGRGLMMMLMMMMMMMADYNCLLPRRLQCTILVFDCAIRPTTLFWQSPASFIAFSTLNTPMQNQSTWEKMCRLSSVRHCSSNNRQSKAIFLAGMHTSTELQHRLLLRLMGTATDVTD